MTVSTSDAAPTPLAGWRGWQQALLALIAGLLTVFAFAPFGWWPLQILTLALMLVLVSPNTLQSTSWQRASWLGWLYGFGWSAAGVYWLYVSLHDFGGMPAPMAALAVLLLAAYVGLYSAAALGLTVWLARRWRSSRLVSALLLAPTFWALFEWLRGWIFTGFPWLVSGYAHSNSPLAGYAPLLGVYGLALVAAAIAGAISLITKRSFGLAILLLVLGALLRIPNWTTPHGAPISVRLLQGAIPQKMKFDDAQLQASLQLYHDMIRAQPADLIVTPETAIPVLLSQLDPSYLATLEQFAQQSGSSLVIGTPIGDAPNHYTNSAIGITPSATSSAPSYRYDKHHLVPFGEFIPFGFHWFVDMMHIPLGDFARGPVLQAAFPIRDQRVLPNICYEDLFGEEIAAQLAAGAANGSAATMLLNMSNIAWFGDTIALPQHLQISQMRALETGRPMLRATNTGATAIIDPKGKVHAELTPFVRNTLAAQVQGYSGLTPYIRFGNGILLVLAALMLALARFFTRKVRH